MNFLVLAGLALKMNYKFQHLVMVLTLGACITLHPGAAMSADNTLLNFKFSHMSNANSKSKGFSYNSDQESKAFQQEKNALAIQFKQYDATLTYPMSFPYQSSEMNIDVGLTLRHLSGYNNYDTATGTGPGFFQETLPLFHASALYNFSFKGLSAGVESSHLAYKQKQFFDYKAKVAYEWRKGFGLEGGWKHQQFRLENSEFNSTSFTQDGPFIDFYLDF